MFSDGESMQSSDFVRCGNRNMWKNVCIIYGAWRSPMRKGVASYNKYAQIVIDIVHYGSSES